MSHKTYYYDQRGADAAAMLQCARVHAYSVFS